MMLRPNAKIKWSNEYLPFDDQLSIFIRLDLYISQYVYIITNDAKSQILFKLVFILWTIHVPV